MDDAAPAVPITAAPATSAREASAEANASQRRAANPAASAWVSASAGSGKTKLLVDRVARLLLAGTAPHRILCLTYTKAAAAEMRNRIARMLGRWATHRDEAVVDELTRLTGVAPDAETVTRARRLFATVLDAPGGLRIDTIHAFCQSVLKRFPVEAGLAPHFDVMDERDAGELIGEAQRELLRSIVPTEDGAGGDARSLAAALAEVSRYTTEDEFPALVGALVREKSRFRAWLAERGIEPGDRAGVHRGVRDTLGLPEDASAAAELAAACREDAARDADLRRVAEAMARGGATGQKHAARILDWLGAGDRETRFEAYQTAFFTGKGERRKSLIFKDALAHAPDGDGILDAEATRLEAVRERCRALACAEATGALLCLAREVVERFDGLKAERALLDYDDLIGRTLSLLRRGQTGAVAWVLFKLDGGIDHLLVDEAQDTSPQQWELIGLLTGEFFTGEGAGARTDRTVFVVGDVKQSIYSFQGASPESFAEMRGFFERRAEAARRSFEKVGLHVSFRSTEPVLEAVDRVFADEDSRDGVGEPGEAIRHLAFRAGRAGRVEVWPLAWHEDADEDDPWALPELKPAAVHPRTRLAQGIARQIADWRRTGERLESENRPITPGDVLVLVRRRSAFVGEIVRELKRAGVPVAGVDRMKLGEQLAVKDLVALGRFLLLPEDDLTLAAVLKGPFVGLGEEALFELAHYREKGETLWRRLVARGAEPAYARAHEMLAGLLAQADFLPPYELYGQVLEARGGRRAMIARLGREAEDPVDEFLSLALTYQRRHAPSLEGFLHWFEAGETEVKRDLEQDVRDEVRVMTVHGAKGLEAPIVFLPDTTVVPSEQDKVLWPEAGTIEAGRTGAPLWVPRRELSPPQAELRRQNARLRAEREYRRLLYVAMTRAADRLYVCGWANKNGPSQGCWYELATRGLAGVESREMDFGAGWSGPGWIIASTGSGDEGKVRGADLGPPPPMPDWLRAAPGPEPAPPQPLAPSRPSEDEPPVRSPLAEDDSHRYRRGLLIHRLLETLPDLPAHARPDAARRYLARAALGLSEAEQAALRDEALAVLDGKETAFLFGPDSLAEVPVTGRAGDRVVSGQIDRLAVTGAQVWIVDYKTNRPPPERVEDVSPVYLRQMAAYRALVSRIYPDREVVCALLWTDALRLMPLGGRLLDAHAPAEAASVAN